MIGIEGPFWNVATLPGWTDPETRKVILRALQQVEEEPRLLGSSAHIMAIARRDTS